MPDRTDEIRTKHTSSRPCGCCPDIFYLLAENEELRREIADVNSENEQLQVALRLSHTLREDLHAANARLRKVADAARDVIYDTQLDGIGVDSDRRLGALSAALDALGAEE